MRQIEIFKATVEHKSHEGLLYYAKFTEPAEKKFKSYLGLSQDIDLSDQFNMFKPHPVALKVYEPMDMTICQRYYDDIERPLNSYINPHHGVLLIPGSMPHFHQFISPLRNAENFKEIESYPFWKIVDHNNDQAKKDVAELKSKGAVSYVWVGHMYEDAWQIRGYEQFLMDMVDRPEFCEYILDKIMEKNIAVAKAAAQAGCDFIMTADDVANQNALMFFPDQWRKMIKSRWAKVYAAAREIKPDIQIWYHSDGNIEQIIGELIDIGVTILNPVQPECIDPIKVKKNFGKKVVLDGTIGTQTTMPFGSSDDVKQVVRQRIKDLNYDGALILSPSHYIEPEVPVENILAFIEACQEV